MKKQTTTILMGFARIPQSGRDFWRKPLRRRGLSLLEMLAAISIMAVVAVVVVPRLGGGASAAKSCGCQVNLANIEVQCQLWRREKGSWPAKDLADVGKDTTFFPDGLPTCPMGDAYQIDTLTGRAVPHAH